MASASLTCINGMGVALPSIMPRHSSTAEEERSRNGKSSMRPVGADSSATAIDACALQPRPAASSAAACSIGIGPWIRVRFWGRALASKVWAARGSDIKAPGVDPLTRAGWNSRRWPAPCCSAPGKHKARPPTHLLLERGVHAPLGHQGPREGINLETHWPPFLRRVSEVFQSEFRVLFSPRRTA